MLPAGRHQGVTRRRRLAVVVVPLLAMAAALSLAPTRITPAGADAPGVTERVSVDKSGPQLRQLPEGGDNPTISADGRFVAFETAEKIDSIDTNAKVDIYVRDRVTGTTTLVSLGFEEETPPVPPSSAPVLPCQSPLSPTLRAAGNGRSFDPSISANGRFVAFTSDACNLVADDRNGQGDEVFVADRGAPNPDGSYVGDPQMTLVSLFGPPTDEDGCKVEGCFEPSISRDGSQVAFVRKFEAASRNEVWIRNRDRGESVRVDPSPSFAGFASMAQPAISADGAHVTYVAMVSYSPLDGKPIPSGQPLTSSVDKRTVLVYDRDADADRILDEAGAVNHDVVNPEQAFDGPDQFSSDSGPSISGDGAVVVYSFRTGTPTTVAFTQVFVANRDPDGDRALLGPPAIAAFSRSPNGTDGDADSSQPAVSTDGRYVAFTTKAKNLDGPQRSDCGLYMDSPCEAVLIGDRLEAGGSLELVSVPVVSPGSSSDKGGDSNRPVVDASGRFVAFASQAPSLITEGTDTNGVIDAFVRELTPELVGAPNPLAFGAGDVGIPSPPLSATFSHDGFGPLDISGVAVVGGNQGDFEVFPAELCTGTILHRGGKCLVSVRFKPSAPGPRSSELVVSYKGANRTTAIASVRLEGGGLDPPVPIFDAQPNPVGFGELLVASVSAPRVVTVTNVGKPGIISVPTFTITSVVLAGANPADFAIVANTCNGATLAPAATCTVTITFNPTAPGARTAVLEFANTAPGAPHLVALEGRAPTPLLQLVPVLGVPGTVVNVVGLNWPAGSPVTLVFDGPPVSEQTVPAAGVSPTGGFVSSLLVLPRSQLGVRTLTGRTTQPAPIGTLTATASVLVTTPTVDGGNDFIFRR